MPVQGNTRYGNESDEEIMIVSADFPYVSCNDTRCGAFSDEEKIGIIGKF
jgi:hypothetical protein